MSVKENLLKLVTIVLCIIFVASQGCVLATQLPNGDKAYFGVSPQMPDGKSYALSTNESVKFWNILRYASDPATKGLQAKTALYSENGNNNIYCIKQGVGFGSGEPSSDSYDTYFNLETKSGREDFKSNTHNESAKKLKDTSINGTDYTALDALVALLDSLYLPDESTEEKKELIQRILTYYTDNFKNIQSEEALLALISNYESRKEDLWKLLMEKFTDDDIKVVQQAAIWYFTNYNEIPGLTNAAVESNGTLSLYYKNTSSDLSYTPLSDYGEDLLQNSDGRVKEGKLRSELADLLYKMLVKEAKENASKYSENAEEEKVGNPIKVETKTLTGEDPVGGNYKLGPITITKQNSKPYIFNIKVKNDEEILETSEYSFVNAEGKTLSESQLVGNDFYILLPVTKVNNISVDITVKYDQKTIIEWEASNKTNVQPLVEVTKTPQTEETKLTFTPKKAFDLALRKYITKIGNDTVPDTRTPVLKVTETASGASVKYEHRKDFVPVKTGDIITYEIAIYNEGRKKGRAEKIVDQLPEGLEFVDVVDGKFDEESYNEGSNNTLILKRKDGNKDNLAEYTGGNNVASETIQITCKVTAKPDAKSNKILTNVAWISEACDESDNNEEVDIDSQPGTNPGNSSTPGVNKDNMSDYTGDSENKEQLEDPEYYYKGQQDDDDFEKLVILPEEPDLFDLSLRKYATKIGDEDVPNPRTPVPVVTQTESGVSVEYKHRKDSVPVRKGDIITYEIAVYNEGQKKGRAEKIVDQLPTGLEFLEVKSDNFDVESYNKDTDNRLTLKRKEGNTDNLDIYKGGSNLDSEIIQITCKVTALKAGEFLTNVAWISEAWNDDDQKKIENQKYPDDEAADADSQPGTNPGETVNKDNMSDYTGNSENPEELDNPDYYYKGQQDDDDFEKLVVQPEGFDLSLRKYVTKIGNDNVPNSRTPVPEVTDIKTGASVKYKHRKDGVPAKKDDIITYEIAIYNEGKKKGRATKIVDQLPTGLEFVEVKSDNFEVESYNKDTDNRLTLKRKDSNKKNLNEYTGGTNLDSEIVEITCKVTAEPDNTSSKVLTNVAWIAEAWNEDDQETIIDQTIQDSEKADIDSQPGTNPGETVNKDNMSDYTGDSGNEKQLDNPDNYYKGQQDDDDFEKLVIQPEGFDLRLKKFVSEKNGEKVADRITDIDVSNLNKLDSNGNIISLDADIKKNEAPVTVQKGDILTYTFRVYNEGMVDGYAAQITESIPDGLEFIWSEKKDAELEADTTLTPDEKEAIKFNQEHYWTISKYNEAHDKVTEITTDFLSKENETTPGSNLIPAFGSNDGTKTKNDLKFKDVAVKLRVIADEITGESIRNEAAITKETDKDNTPIDEDRDSNPNDWVKYEDDEDYDEVTLNALDLALRKFIVAISEDENVEDSEYMKNGDGTYTREPKVDTSKLNKKDENGNKITTAVYEQSKDPVIIGPNYTIIYMLRVYNEGDVDAYAGEVKDHLPPNLEFVDGEFNKKYGWTVSDNGRTVTTKYLSGDEWLIKKAIKDDEGNVTDLDFVDVPIMCKVSANIKSGENITNIADIAEYLDPNKDPAPDRDSEKDDVKLPDDKDLPNYDEKDSDHQDDDNYEKVVIKTFDLSLKKWTTQAIVIDNGKQTVTQTGHNPYEEPEQIVKVEIKQNKLNTVTIKFRYSIRVTNEGDIEGYAKEITDYIPNGFKFVPEDNPGWTDKGNNQVSTRLLENTLLQPGQYADVDIVLTWINSESGLGAVSKNTAEITEDYNRYNIPDKDSTPGNRKDGEDDQDNAQVLLSIKTGQVRIYFSLIFTVLITTASGIVLIKKYVL